MSHFEEVREEAYRLFDDGRFQNAYLTFREAAAEAQKLGLYDQVMLCVMNAFFAGGKANVKPTDRFALLLEVKQLMQMYPDSIPTGLNSNFRGGVNLAIHDHIAEYTPRRQLLEENFENLKDVHPSDLSLARSRYCAMRGEWTKAAEFAEQAWSNYEPTEKEDFSSAQHSPQYPKRAFYAHLTLGNKLLAQQWLDSFSREVKMHRCPNCRDHYLNACVEHSLALSEPIAIVRARLADAQSQKISVEAFCTTDYLSVRVHLLNPNVGDPCAPSHPGLTELARRRPVSNRSVMEQYTHLLALLDFRLAALRFAAGLAPIDDDRHAGCLCEDSMLQKRISVLARSVRKFVHVNKFRCSQHEIRRRLAKARQAGRFALRAAQTLDNLLECDWRQCDVQRRINCVEEIADGMKTEP